MTILTDSGDMPDEQIPIDYGMASDDGRRFSTAGQDSAEGVQYESADPWIP